MTAINIVGIVFTILASPEKQVLMPIQAFDPATFGASVYAL